MFNKIKNGIDFLVAFRPQYYNLNQVLFIRVYPYFL